MRVAVIGTGFGKHAAAPAYETLGFDVEVVSPRDDSAVQKAIASDVDLVSVHSPPFMHLDHVTAAIDHGHAVLCDKPFGRNAAEAEAMRDRARDAGVLGFLNFEFRFNDAWSQAQGADRRRDDRRARTFELDLFRQRTAWAQVRLDQRP